mgnify:CR=1 FL=1
MIYVIPQGTHTIKNVSIEQSVKRLAKLPLHHEPGERFTYSEGLDVLGYLIEIISGQSFSEFLEEHLFEPLGMSNTQFYLNEDQYRAGLWIGNKIQVPLHNDFPNNVACVIGGRRKFTLIPPNQFENLYVGPIDFTPAGRAVSMVDLQNPDLDKYPKFAVALEHALTAELSPGDIIYIPSM